MKQPQKCVGVVVLVGRANLIWSTSDVAQGNDGTVATSHDRSAHRIITSMVGFVTEIVSWLTMVQPGHVAAGISLADIETARQLAGEHPARYQTVNRL
jgi:hypothetical protein